MAGRAAHHHFMRRAHIFSHAMRRCGGRDESVEYHKYLIEFSVPHQTCFLCQLKLCDAAAYDGAQRGKNEMCFGAVGMMRR